MQATNDWLGGYVKWFTDLPANNGYPRTVIFYLADPMVVVEMGPVGVTRIMNGDALHRGVQSAKYTPSFFSIDYTHTYDAELVVADLKPRNCRTVGLVAKGALPNAFVTHITTALGEVKFTDATAIVDKIKAIKSAEELSLIRACADMQDQVFATVLDHIKPGMRDIDVIAFAQWQGQLLGSEQGIFLGGSAPLGTASPFLPRYMQGRRLQKGDHLSLLIENNGPGGFYTELARTIVLGKASNELKDGFESVREAQAYTLSLIKPGASCADIHAAHNDYMRQHGLPPELRLYAHGQGYDLVERPLIRSDETMTLEAGMNLAVHPGFATESIFAVICDNYIVEDGGVSECLHRTEKRLFELPI